ncbi:hypothetical protein ACJA23_02175 [Mycoplasma corogypsi]|uniref:hypothetical protein n=1 Tax=Mycoplasma corogypsi TaxID=2106 RepID=UPI00387386B3
MFNYSMSKARFEGFKFGQRRIPQKFMAEAYFTWFQKYHKDFPYYTTTNSSISFDVSDTGYVRGSWGNYNFAQGWLYEGIFKENLKEFIKKSKDLIKEGMSDLDKFYVLYQHVTYWYRYDLTNLAKPLENILIEHTGVCASIASTLEFLLNLHGVSAVSLVTGYPNLDFEFTNYHQLVWVKLKLPGTNEYKWYTSDPTYGKQSTNKNHIYPFASTIPGIINYQEFLFGAGVSPTKGHSGVQFFNSKFWFMNWVPENVYYAPTKTEGVFPNGWMMSFVDDPNDKRSSYQYWDGKWYALRRYQYKDSQTNKVKYKTQFISNTIDTKTPTEESLSSFINDENIAKEIMLQVSDANKLPLFYSYKSLFFFVRQNNSGVNYKQIYVYDKQTNIGKTITIDTNKRLINFYVDYNGLHCQLSDNSWVTIKPESNQELKSLIDGYKYTKQDIINELVLAKTIINSFTIGNNMHQMSVASKKEFDKFSKELSLRVLLANQSTDLKPEIAKINDKVEEILAKVRTKYQKVFLLNIPSEKYFINKADFDRYGYKFNLNRPVAAEIKSIINTYVDVYNFDVYYSETKGGNYQKIISDVRYGQLSINNQNFTKQKGWIKLKIKVQYDPNNTLETKPFYLEITDDNNLVYYESGLKFGYQNTNYNLSKKDWFDQEVNLDINVGVFDKYNVTNKLLYVNFDNLTLKEIDSNLNTGIRLGKINNSNHGIYVIEQQLTSKTDPNLSFKVYTNSFFAFTKEDINKSSDFIINALNVFNK